MRFFFKSHKMPSKKKRVSAFAVKCKETNKEKRTKDKKKSGKPKEEHVEVIDNLRSLQNEKVLHESDTRKSRKSRRGKKLSKEKVESPGATDKVEQKEKHVHNETAKDDSILEKDNGTFTGVTDTKINDRFESEKKYNKNRSSADEEEIQIEDNNSLCSGMHHESENTNKRKSVDNDKNPVAFKKSKKDLNEKTHISSEKNTLECDTDSNAWIEMGRRLQSRAGYDDLDVGEQTSMEVDITKSPTAIPVDGSVLVIASHPCEFPLKGFVTVQSLIGTASIMGYKLEPGCQGHDVYSPDCNSLVTVSTVEGVTNAKSSVNRLDTLLSLSDRTVINSLKNTLKESKPFVVLKFDKLKTTLCSFISNFHPYINIFKVDGDRTLLNKQLLPLSVKMPGKDVETPRLSIPEQLESVLDIWKENLTQPIKGQPVILVCGGKDSGKSTSNRLLINTTLNICESVYYLECDIGQTEFTPPGVLSLVKVTSPVLGPPFTHQRKSICSYHYGSVTPKDNPDLYIRCVQLCVQEYQCAQHDGPLIVNTMGWMKGLGWQLLLDTVRLVSPSIIVQLTSNKNSQNVAPVTVGDLRQTSWTDLSKMFTGETIERKMDRVPKIIHLEATVSTSYNFRMKSTDYRNLTILSHLGADLEPGLTLTSMAPFTVSWKDVAIHMCHIEVPRSQVMYALNANMVALCEGDISKAEMFTDDGPLFLGKSKQPFRWHGYGLVRGIDMMKKKIYVVTSLTNEELARVNVLDIGGICPPENFFISQKGDKVLYVDEVVESKGLSAVRPRKHMPRKGLRGNN